MQSDHMPIPLSQLVRSPFNVRKKQGASIESLAASIESMNLIHNLVVHPLAGRSRSKAKFGVADGGRRLEAMELLVSKGKWKASQPVQCRRITEDEAVAMSLAANIEREPMHAADEYEAFKYLHDQGKPIEDIAAAFGVTPLVVSRRLRLANAAPRFLALLREDAITLEQLVALAITEDHAKQEQVWDALPKHSRHAHAIRAALTESEIDAKRDRIARYVGLKAYEKAGGAVRRDLFSDEDTGYIQDAALLHQLAQAKLEKRLPELEAEGWAWSEARLNLDYSERSAFGKVGSVRRTPTKAEAKAIAKLQEQIASMRKIEESFNGEIEPLTDEQLDELDELEAKLRELEDTLQVPDPKAKALAGVIITIGDDGKAAILRGLIRPEDKKVLARSREASAPGGDEDSEPDASARSVYSEKLTQNLTAHFTAGLQLCLARSPDIALVAMCEQLVQEVFDQQRFNPRQASCVGIRHSSPYLRSHADNIEQSPAFQEMAKLREAWSKRIPGDNRFAWLSELPQMELLQLLAVCVALSVDAVNKRRIDDCALQLARTVSLDMADWWKPTSDAFLNHVPKAVVIEAVTEGVSATVAAPMQKAKKAELVTTAEAALASTRWVPAMLRTQ